MQNKIKFMFGFVFGALLVMPGFAEEVIDVEMEEISASAVADYQVEGSLFEQITVLEQEKVLMQLEKERAQLDLELDRLAAEKIKLHMEIDTLSGRAEQQQQELETEKAKLEAEAAKLEVEKEKLLAQAEQAATAKATKVIKTDDDSSDVDIASKYRLVNVIGAGNQLQATVQDLSSGQNKRISVGKLLDGLVIKSISLDDGVVFADKNGATQTLNVTSSK